MENEKIGNVKGRKQKIDAMQKQIKKFAEELAKLTDKAKFSDNIKNYFDFLAKFHKYSWNNRILIYSQNPNASFIAGFRAWQNRFDRKVSSGEKAIWIYAPRTFKEKKMVKKFDDDGKEIEIEEEVEHLYFTPVPVFDVSQTKGGELPKVDYGTSKNDHPELLKSLEGVCEKEGIKLAYKPLRSGLNGFSANKAITINSKLSVDSKVTTLSHELGHEFLHWDEDKGEYNITQRETEAEAVGFIVARFYGVETKAFNYLALYSSNGELVLNSLERISRAVSKILNNINIKEA